MDEVFVIWGQHCDDRDFFVAGIYGNKKGAEAAAGRLNDNYLDYTYSVGVFTVYND